MNAISSTGRIVVGVDGSAPSATAAEWAARRAERQGVGLTVVAILPPLQVPLSLTRMLREKAVDYNEEVHEASRRKLEAAAEELRAAHPGIDLVAELVEGSEPAMALVEASRDALLVVTGARGLGTARVMALGSVSRHLVTHAQGLVAVVPETGLAVDDQARGTVVVGVQDAERSVALPVAAREAADLGGRLLAAHAWEYSPVGIDGLPAMDSMLFEGVRDDLGEQLRQQVTRRLGEQLEVPLEVHVDLAKGGELLVALSHRAELVVVGARAASGLRGMLLGSTAVHVLREAISPVLVVPITQP